MTDDAGVREARKAGFPWWQALRMALVIGWLAWAAVSWWVAPREDGLADARADLTGGRVVSYEWGESWVDNSGLLLPGGRQLRTGDTDGPIFVWHTSDGRQHYTILEGGTGPARQAVAEAVRVFEATGSADELPVRSIGVALGIAGTVLALWALASASAAPVTGTKWFWFWIIFCTPLGLGMLWWLATERPWTTRARPRTGPDGRPRPLRWWAGIGIALLASAVLAFGWWGLHNVLGDDLVPYVS